MKARLLIHMAGEPGYAPGDLAEGLEAVRLIAAGYAEQVIDEETASQPVTTEKAVKKSTVKVEKPAEDVGE